MAKGTVAYVNPRFFTIRTDKGYNVTILFQDFVCGHVKLLEHRRGGKKVDQAHSRTGKKTGAAAAGTEEEKAESNQRPVGRPSGGQAHNIYHPGEFSKFERLEALALVKAKRVPAVSD